MLRNTPDVPFVPVTGVRHDPAVVAARFPLPGVTAAREGFGLIYRDGTCSCGQFKINGECVHVQAWGVQHA